MVWSLGSFEILAVNFGNSLFDNPNSDKINESLTKKYIFWTEWDSHSEVIRYS